MLRLFKATNRNGLGAACTAVLVKLRLPRISYRKSDKVMPKSRWWYLKSLNLDLRVRSIEVLCNDDISDSSAVELREVTGSP